MNKKLTLIVFIGLVLVFVFVIFTRMGPKKDGYKDSGMLRVGVSSDVPQMGYQDVTTGATTGFEIDIAKEIAKNVYGDATLINMSAVNMRTKFVMLDKEQIDCIISTTEKDANPKYHYSTGYYKDEIKILYKNGINITFSDLMGKRIGYINGSVASQKLIETLDKQNINYIKVPLESYPDAKEQLEKGTLDVFCANNINMTTIKSDSFKEMPVYVGDVEYSIVTRKQDENLGAKLQKGLDTANSEGVIQNYLDKWFKE